MEVSRVRIDNYTPDKKIRAECSVFFDEELCVHHVHVITGRKGDFVAFPNTGEMKKYNRSSRYASIVHPCNETLRKKVQDAVLKEFDKWMSEMPAVEQK